MYADILADVFRGTEVKPLTTRNGDDLIAQFRDMVLLITSSVTDLKAINVFRLNGFQIAEPICDREVVTLLCQLYQDGMANYLRGVAKAGNAEHLPEPAKSYLLRHVMELFDLDKVPA